MPRGGKRARVAVSQADLPEGITVEVATESAGAAAAAHVRSVAPGFRPRLILTLGSGMGKVAGCVERVATIPYGELPGFPVSSVEGHAGNLILGHLEGVPVACLQGRVHLYEGTDPQQLRVPLYALRILGAETLFLTSAVGSLRPEATAGSLVFITDHINMQAKNPLIGPNDVIGTRFPSLLDAYDPALRATAQACAAAVDVRTHEGVYCACLGPSFETPAEIRAFRTLGADVVGMSTVGEVIAARHCGIRVVALSIVVNLAAGMTDEHITHEDTLKYTSIAADNVTKVVTEFCRSKDKWM